MNSNIHSLPAILHARTVWLYTYFTAHRHRHRRRRLRHRYWHPPCIRFQETNILNLYKISDVFRVLPLAPGYLFKIRTRANPVQMLIRTVNLYEIRPLLGRTRLSCPETVRQNQNTLPGSNDAITSHILLYPPADTCSMKMPESQWSDMRCVLRETYRPVELEPEALSKTKHNLNTKLITRLYRVSRTEAKNLWTHPHIVYLRSLKSQIAFHNVLLH